MLLINRFQLWKTLRNHLFQLFLLEDIFSCFPLMYYVMVNSISELDSADSEKHSSKLDQVIFKLDKIDFYWPVIH